MEVLCAFNGVIFVEHLNSYFVLSISISNDVCFHSCTHTHTKFELLLCGRCLESKDEEDKQILSPSNELIVK